MYGLVNKAIEEMVCMQYGEPVWEKIKQTAGADMDMFMSNESYPDELTYKLVSSASGVLGAPAETILEAFGEHWVLHTAVEGYGSLLGAAGKSLPEFLQNLPNFHARVSMIFPNLQPPRFNCSDVGPNSLRLHYYTHRPGLSHFVIGLMRGLGKLFKTPVQVVLAESKEKGAEHDIFEVSWKNPEVS